MAFVKDLFDKNFIEYASYVIRDRAIPDLEDGLKPVQRRIMHTLFEMDDGRFQKVANVVGRVMKYHPHGDASIGGALVVLANKGIFIERQGNFGNMFTGDGASAPRYIECRLHPLAKDFLVTNPSVTKYVPNYDGRDVEPVVYRAKIPVALIIGAEGIAVGMSTKILPYNIREVLDAEIKYFKGEPFTLFPDVPTGGLIDVTNYKDGNGKIVTRAKFDVSDEKRVVITELPVDSTSKDLTESIESAFRAGKIKISSIEDYTTDHTEIEIRLPRGVYARDVIDSLYAYTDCEKSVSCQMLVIKDNMPIITTATEIIAYYAEKLTAIIRDELEFEKGELSEELFARTLERIFIEERIYKRIEQMKTADAVNKAVREGFVPFKAELLREISDDDIETLLKIPIRRISLFDINKNRDRVKAINARLKEIARRLKKLTECAIEYLEGMLSKFKGEEFDRHTAVQKFSAVDVKEIAQRDKSLRYDDRGYLGTSVIGGSEVLKVSPYDRIIYVRQNGMYTITETPEKIFIDKGARYIGFGGKEELAKTLFTVIFRDEKTKFIYIKRCRIQSYIMNRDYFLAGDGDEVLHVDTRESFSFEVHYVKTPKAKILSERFNSADYEEKSVKTQGTRLSSKAAESVTVESAPAKEEEKAGALQPPPLD